MGQSILAQGFAGDLDAIALACVALSWGNR